MRIALFGATASLLVGGTALAQAPGAELPAGPAPAPEQPAPAPSAPGAEQPAEPKVDPAYGEAPEHDPADGGGSYFAAPKGKDIVVKMHPDRSKQNVMGIAITAGAGVVIGALGLAFHMDSKSKSDEVGADRFSGQPWTAALEDKYDSAHRSAIAAGVLYGLGGGLLIGAAVVYMVTEPKVETRVIHPHVSVGPNAAMVGGGWRF